MRFLVLLFGLAVVLGCGDRSMPVGPAGKELSVVHGEEECPAADTLAAAVDTLTAAAVDTLAQAAARAALDSLGIA